MKIYFTLLLVLAAVLTRAQAGKVTISGVVAPGKEVILKNTDHFNIRSTADNKGRFSLTFSADTGYFELNDQPLYLEPGMKLVRKADGSFRGKGAEENNLLLRLDTLIRNYVPFSGNNLSEGARLIDPETFIRSINDYKNAASALLAGGQQYSDHFLHTEREKTDYTGRYYYYLFSLSYGVDKKKEDSLNDDLAKTDQKDTALVFRKLMAINVSIHTKRFEPAQLLKFDSLTWRGFDINKEELYRSSSLYRQLIDMSMERARFYSKNKPDPYPFKSKIDLVRKNNSNVYIREALLYQLTKILLTVESKSLGTYYTDYIRDATDTVYLAEIKKIHENLERYAAGAQAPEFTYRDVDDKVISSSSLLGHYVYIDIWATWCEPCKKELPYLKALEKKYEGKNIVFVSISVDRQQDTGKWKQFVRSNELKGLQVIADKDFSSEFIADFGINAIPRFILIGPDGKIISEDADRPSHPALEAWMGRTVVQ
jgi:thiol-disulfide isomerase/thioredoxin